MKYDYAWVPDEETILASNIYKMMELHTFEVYDEFYNWSVNDPNRFWRDTMDLLEIRFDRRYDMVCDASDQKANPKWLKGAEFNIVESCFRHADSALAIAYKHKSGELTKISHQDLKTILNRVANALKAKGLKKGDQVLIVSPMTIESIAIYLAVVKSGMVAVTMDETLSAAAFKSRLALVDPKISFVACNFEKEGQNISPYTQLVEAGVGQCVMINPGADHHKMQPNDEYWDDFLSDNHFFMSVPCLASDPITILFGESADGSIKTIPWTQCTPIKSASDGFYYQNLQNSNVMCWPAGLSEVMGPWLIFASLINEAAMAIYEGKPTDKAFGKFLKETKVNVLGIEAKNVNEWMVSGCMKGIKWPKLKSISVTGEASDPQVHEFLLKLGHKKPIIEFKAAAELGGGYVSGSVIQPALPGTFSAPVLGAKFVLLDNENNESNDGKVHFFTSSIGFLNSEASKSIGISKKFDGPKINGRLTLAHDEHLEQLSNGYFRPKKSIVE